MIQSWPTLAKDFADFTPRMDEVALFTDFDDQAFKLLSESAAAMTLYAENDDKIGIIGAHIVRPGCASAWALLSDSISDHPIETTHQVKLLIEAFASANNLRRLDMLVNAGSDRNARWSRILGFEEEARLRYFGDDGEDLLLMVRYWDVRI